MRRALNAKSPALKCYLILFLRWSRLPDIPVALAMQSQPFSRHVDRSETWPAASSPGSPLVLLWPPLQVLKRLSILEPASSFLTPSL